MFFIKDLTHTINLHPSFFGPTTHQYLTTKLHADVEGTCTGKYGYIIAVLAIITVGSGTIQPGTGMAEFEVRYKAIVYRPFKGEVLEGTVSNVNKMGFFADVGPLTVFVSTHLIPTSIFFDSGSNPPAFRVKGQEQDDDTGTITKGTKVRLKIVGTRVDATEIFAIGTIKEEFLGAMMSATHQNA